MMVLAVVLPSAVGAQAWAELLVLDNFNTGVVCDVNDNRVAPRDTGTYGAPPYTKVGNWGWIPSRGMSATVVGDQLAIGATTDESSLLGVWLDPTFAAAITGKKYEAAADFIFTGADVNNPRASQLAVSVEQASSAYTSHGVTASLTSAGAWGLYVDGVSAASGTASLPAATNHVVLAIDETGTSTTVSMLINGNNVGTATNVSWYGSARYLGVGASVAYLNTVRNAYFDNLSLTTVPEPSTIVILSSAVAGLVAYAWRKRRAM